MEVQLNMRSNPEAEVIGGEVQQEEIGTEIYRGERGGRHSNVVDSVAIEDSAWRPVAVSVLFSPAASVAIAGNT